MRPLEEISEGENDKSSFQFIFEDFLGFGDLIVDGAGGNIQLFGDFLDGEFLFPAHPEYEPASYRKMLDSFFKKGIQFVE